MTTCKIRGCGDPAGRWIGERHVCNAHAMRYHRTGSFKDGHLERRKEIAKRRRQVARLFKRGYSSQEIAAELCVSPATVNTDRQVARAEGWLP